MKAITCPVILTGAATRVDGSLSLRLVTPELPADEKVVFMELQNLNLKLILAPADAVPVDFKESKSQFERRTPSQRLRATLFVLWKQGTGEMGGFEDFYRREMEQLIETVKARLGDSKP